MEDRTQVSSAVASSETDEALRMKVRANWTNFHHFYYYTKEIVHSHQ